MSALLLDTNILMYALVQGAERPAPTVAHVLTMVDDVASVLCVVVPGTGTVQAALRGVERHPLSFWDAMIRAVARENGIEEIVTEETSQGRVIEGIRYTNPFRS